MPSAVGTPAVEGIFIIFRNQRSAKYGDNILQICECPHIINNVNNGGEPMENIEFHRDYSEYWSDLSPDEYDKITDADKFILQAMYDYDKMAPKVLNPDAKIAYDRMLQACDGYAREYGGIVNGKVDYGHFSASIDLIVPYFEFASAETKKFLLMADLLADSVYFNPTEKGWVNMRTEYRYFVAAHTAEESTEFHSKIHDFF